MADASVCDRCGAEQHDPAHLPQQAYAYLLGMYLGDGHIVAVRRAGYRLRVFLDARYPGIVVACAEAMNAVMPGTRAHVQPHGPGCLAVGRYSRQWPCLFPQHGPGRKHDRKIELVDWQQTIVDAHPEPLVRGLIHSDGWRGTNRVTVNGKAYAYPRYQFSNRSEDIKRIFCDALDALGVEWRVMTASDISIAKRASVARLDAAVGRKW